MKKSAGRWSAGAGGLAAAGLFSLPLPLPTPSLPSLALPSPSVPSVVATASPPALLTSPPSALATPESVSVGSSPSPVATPAPNPTSKPGPITVPFTTISVSSPLDVALLGALATLPLLLAIWLLMLGRTLREARRLREAELRLMLAADLGIRPKDVAAMSTETLFELREKSAFDGLTGTFRRGAGISVAEKEIALSRRRKSPLAVAFVDIDDLKEVNERAGRAAGDAMLRALAALLRHGLRDEDVVFRYGGDEFVCVVPEMTIRDLRQELDAVQREAATQGIRMCFGVAELVRSDDVVSLFARADGQLYEFKANRGQIVPLPAKDRPTEEHTVPA